ncbi:MAG: S9 family peptidase [Deltaproteobacteria bacterium]|nr:S9 family peptidase [Deltaproteobacteria bacterium]MBW2531836.1 S9 family peptidase [Deltaproteobacteria bacterium]
MRFTVPLLFAAALGCSAAPTPVEVEPATTAAPSTSAAATAPPPAFAYPATRQVDQVDLLHGVKVADPYRWLEQETAPEVQAWMKAQDAFARDRLRRLPERGELTARLEQLMYIDAVWAPIKRGGRYFYTRRHADQEKAIVYWTEGKGGAPQVLLDPNAWSADGSVALSGWSVSWDGKTVAYRKSENNSDEATLYVKDVATSVHSAIDTIAGAKYAHPSWTPDSRSFYYTWLPTDPAIPARDRPGYAEVRHHRLGQDPTRDGVVRERTKDPSLFLDAGVSRDGRFLLLNVHHGWSASDAYVMDLREPAARRSWRPLATGMKAHYYPYAHRGRLYVHSDEGAPRYRVFRVDPARLERAAWTEVVPEQRDATLDGVRILGGRLALTYLESASSRVEIRELDGSLVREVPLPGIGTVSGPLGRSDDDEAYFTFESFTTPPEVHETSIRTGRTSLHSRVKVPVDPSRFAVEQVFYRSKDGTRVSMFIVRPKDFVRDGNGRALLFGYGGFQISETPEFRAYVYPWLERGGLFAVPNLRGGGEYGEQWHRAGMRLHKQNVFDDFIAAAEHLIAERYTRPERLVIRGGSNGGLLVGAAITQRPELFRAALCGVPLLDMVRYHLFGSGKTWTSEYGSADEPDLFRALYAYSPYHRVREGVRYPALLLLSADSDDRVDPMHARKFAARLQQAGRGGPVLLRIETKAGHGGADRVRASVDKLTDELAFALAHTGSR